MAPTESPVEGGAAVADAPIEVTEELIDRMSRDGDIEGLHRLSDQLSARAAAPRSDAAPDAPSAEGSAAPHDAPPAGSSPAQVKQWKARRRGQTIEHPDPDNYLGYGKFDIMKSKHVELKKDLEESEQEIAKARQFGETTASELRQMRTAHVDLQKRYDDAIAEAKRIQAGSAAAPAAGTTPPAAPAPSSAPAAGTQPVKPTFPADMPEDRLEWTKDDWKKFDEYNEKLVEYGVAAATAAIPKSQSTALPPEFQEMKAELETYKKERQDRLASEENKKKDDARKEADRAMWDGMRDFQRQHSDYGTKDDVTKLNENVWSWMYKIAKANGVECPYGADANQRAQYELRVKQIAHQFNTGDPAVVSRCEGIETPEGKDQYFKLAQLFVRRKQLIDEGMLTEKAPLHAAWLWNQDASGELDKQIEAVEREALTRGQTSVLESMSQAQQFAQHAPANSAGAPQTKLDAKAIKEIMTKASTAQGRQEINENPELKKIFELAKASLPPGIL